MTTYATAADIHAHIPSSRSSLIIPSGAVNPRWLSAILPPLWFGGDHVPDFAVMPVDCRPVRVDQWNVECNGGLS